MPFVEWGYNNSYNFSIGMAPFEALYLIFGTTLVKENQFRIVQQTIEKVALIGERIKTAQTRQKAMPDKERRHLEFERETIYLKVSPSKGIIRLVRRES